MSRTLSPVLAAALAVLLVSLGSMGCSDPTPAPAAPTAPETPAARVTVHEWGLIAHHYRDDARALTPVVTAGATRAPAPRPYILGNSYKPVIYIHVDGTEAQLSVRVGAPHGEIVEHLPTTTRTATPTARTSVAWEHITATPATCATTTTLAPDDARCRTADAYCEALENGAYDTHDAACLASEDGSRHNHLFYRARIPVGALPLAFSRPDGEIAEWVARNTGPTAIPGKLIVVFRDVEVGDQPPYVRLVDPPAPGARVKLPGDGDAFRAYSMREPLREVGLTDEEADAFTRAWDASMFGDVDVSADARPGGFAPAPLRQTPIAVYYFAPDDALARVLPLEVTPTPERVVRAMLVKVDLYDEPGSLDVPVEPGASVPP